MANYIRLTASLGDSDASYRDFRDEVSALTDDDVSQTSPVTAGGNEVGVIVTDDEVTLTVEGHGGEFTKTTESALIEVIEDVLGEDAEVTVEGGYTEDDEDTDEAESEWVA